MVATRMGFMMKVVLNSPPPPLIKFLFGFCCAAIMLTKLDGLRGRMVPPGSLVPRPSSLALGKNKGEEGLGELIT
jgi:hypothetical protein